MSTAENATQTDTTRTGNPNTSNNNNNERIMAQSLTFRDAYKAIPNYDGKNMPVERFARICKRVSSCLNPQEVEQLLKLIPSKLTGSANIIIEAENPPTIDSLIKTLKRAFSTNKDLGDLENELNSITQNYDESVIEFAAKMREILNLITDKLRDVYARDNQQEILQARIEEATAKAKRAYVRGLISNIGSQLFLYNAESFDEIVDRAQTIEYELKKQKRARGTSDMNQTGKVHFVSQENEYCDIHQSHTHSTANCRSLNRLRDEARKSSFQNRYRNNSRDRYQKNNYRNNSQDRYNNYSHERQSRDRYNNYSQNKQRNHSNDRYQSQNRDNSYGNQRDNSQNRYRNDSQNRQNNSFRQNSQDRYRQNNSQDRYRNNSRDRSRGNSQNQYRHDSRDRQRNNSDYRSDSRDRQRNNSNNRQNNYSQQRNSRQNSPDRNPRNSSRESENNQVKQDKQKSRANSTEDLDIAIAKVCIKNE